MTMRAPFTMSEAVTPEARADFMRRLATLGKETVLRLPVDAKVEMIQLEPEPRNEEETPK